MAMRRTLQGLEPYRPPETDRQGVALHRNTNRWGAHPAVRELLRGLSIEIGVDVSEYPSGDARPVREALAARFQRLGLGPTPDCFLVTNGSNEAFDVALKALLDPGEAVAVPSPSYSMYRAYALMNGLRLVEAPLGPSFELDPDALLATKAEAFIVCSPNNPTGTPFAREAVDKLIKTGKFVILDEAYAEFSDEPEGWLPEALERENVIVARTLSKAFGLAGLRVGYLVARPSTIERLNRARLPYNVNALSQALAVRALREPDYAEEYAQFIRKERPRWARALKERGFRVWPSQANFLLAEVPEGVGRDALVGALAAQGVHVRAAGAHPRLRRCVRVTIGTPDDLSALLRALDAALPRAPDDGRRQPARR